MMPLHGDLEPVGAARALVGEFVECLVDQEEAQQRHPVGRVGGEVGRVAGGVEVGGQEQPGRRSVPGPGAVRGDRVGFTGLVDVGVGRVVETAQHPRHVFKGRVAPPPVVEAVERLAFEVDDDHVLVRIEDLPQVVVPVHADRAPRHARQFLVEPIVEAAEGVGQRRFGLLLLLREAVSELGFCRSPVLVAQVLRHHGLIGRGGEVEVHLGGAAAEQHDPVYGLSPHVGEEVRGQVRRAQGRRERAFLDGIALVTPRAVGFGESRHPAQHRLPGLAVVVHATQHQREARRLGVPFAVVVQRPPEGRHGVEPAIRAEVADELGVGVQAGLGLAEELQEAIRPVDDDGVAGVLRRQLRALGRGRGNQQWPALGNQATVRPRDRLAAGEEGVQAFAKTRKVDRVNEVAATAGISLHDGRVGR